MKHPYSDYPETVEIDGIYYNLVTKIKEAKVTSNPNDYSGTVNIPETVTYNNVTYSVTSIGRSAFYGCSGLTSVTIPNSVKSIGDFAFDYCDGLTSVTIPNSIKSIGRDAFAFCGGLKKVIVQDIAAWCGITFEKDDYSGDYKSNPLYYAKHLYSDETTEITNLIIPNSVTSIGNYAFYRCSGLTSVTIPNSVTSIRRSAFEGCSGLEKVIVPDIAAWCGIAFHDYNSNPLCYAKHLYSDETTEITNLIIPSSVISIGEYAFCVCVGLTSVTIPNSVTSIGSYTFAYCSSLTSVTIPNSVKSIGSEAFSCCSGLTSVNIPNSVKSIGSEAFSCCSGLTSVNIPNSVKSIGRSAFCDCSGLTSVTIPNSVISIGEYAFIRCSSLTSVNIGNSVKNIGEKAFADCAELTDVYCYAENVPSTQSDAFDGSYTKYATLHVPAASVEQYKVTAPWSNFGTIVATDEDAVAEVQAVPVLIQTQGNTINVQGAEAGTEIILYGTNGVQLDSVIATTGTASLNASGLSGSVAIVKIGNKTVKVLIKQ